MKHVLVIEDENDILYPIRYFLVKKGYRVSTAENGRRGWQLISQSTSHSHPIDLIITDIMLPDITGLELLKKIREQDLDIPVLVITAFGNKDLLIRLMRLGCMDYLDKPFTSAALLQRVNDVFKRIEIKGKGDYERG
jgi:DNA-binding response OmpR family regulator